MFAGHDVDADASAISAIDGGAVDLLPEREVLSVLVITNLRRTKDVGYEDIREVLCDFLIGHVRVLDLFLDVDLHIREIFVVLAVSLDEGLGLQSNQGCFNRSGMQSDVYLRIINHQYGDVSLRRFELCHPLEKKERLQDACFHAIAEEPNRSVDHLVKFGAYRRLNPIVHLIEGGQTANLVSHHYLCDILKDGKHGPLTNRVEFPCKCLMDGQLLERQLE